MQADTIKNTTPAETTTSLHIGICKSNSQKDYPYYPSKKIIFHHLESKEDPIELNICRLGAWVEISG